MEFERKKERLFVGCLAFVLSAVAGAIVWSFVHLWVMSLYRYSVPGGHHFGGEDLANLEAAAAGVIFGPLTAWAFMVLLFVPSIRAKLVLVPVLLAIPVWFAASFVKEYSKRDSERRLRSKDSPHSLSSKPDQ